MSILGTDYGRVVELSERVAWKLDDVFPPGTSLDFGKPFMPGPMFFGGELSFLQPAEKLKLNQILGNSYRYLFYFIEAYVINMAMRQAMAELYGDDDALRAMLRFAEEEVKHQKMFLRFGEMFSSGFGTRCDGIESPQAAAAFIMSKSPMAVLLVTLHLELATQAHYVACMRDSQDMEPLFQSLFRHHWLEEAQHAKLDALELTRLRREAAPEEVQQAIDDYFAIANEFAELLVQQAKLDVGSLERAVGRTFAEAERREIERVQTRSYQRAFLWSGVANSLFLEFLAEHFPAALKGAARAAEVFG